MCGFAFGIHQTSQSRFSAATLSVFFTWYKYDKCGYLDIRNSTSSSLQLIDFMIIVPMAFVLDFKNVLKSSSFKSFSVAVTVLHVFMFWLIYAGFIPQEFNGLIQCLWAVPTMGWFSVAAHMLILHQFSVNKSIQPTANASAD